MKVWVWLNGKKMAIGLTLVAVGHLAGWAATDLAPALTAFGVSAVTVAHVVQGFGYLATGVGAAHKFIKEL
jgi:hypothetical protein